MKQQLATVVIIGACLAAARLAPAGQPVGLGFTYQGQVLTGNTPLTGTADFQFTLWDAAGLGDPPTGGAQLGTTQTITNVAVEGGLFSVVLNQGGQFGGIPFRGDARWLQMAIRHPAGSGSFATFGPRQRLTAAPYAFHSILPWETWGPNQISYNGSVGIQNPSPEAPLHVLGGTDASLAGGGYVVLGATNVPTLSNLVFDDNEIIARVNGGVSGLFLNAPGGDVLIANQGPGRVGIGTANPEAPLHVLGGTDAALAGGGYLVLGSTGSNLAFDDNEIMARSNGGISGLFLNSDGGNVLVAPNGPGYLGVGTFAPVGPLHVHGEPLTIGGTLAVSGNTHAYMSFFPQGVGAGRKAWFGFGAADTNDISLVNEAGDIALGPGGGDVFVDGALSVGNMLFGDFNNVQWQSTTGRLYYDTSTRRHKENITPLKDNFGRLLDAQPVTYTRPGNPDRWEIGYIAENIDDLGLTRLVFYDEENRPNSLNYEKMVLYLAEIAKAQRRQLDEQQTRLAEQSDAVRRLQEQLAGQQQQNAALEQRLQRLETLLSGSASK